MNSPLVGASLFVVASVAHANPAHANPATHFGVIAVDSAPSTRVGALRTLRLTVSEPEALVRTWGPQQARIDNGVVIAHWPPARSVDTPEAQTLSPSFVVDYDEPAILEKRAALKAKYAGRPTPNQIAAFVAQAIKPGGGRLFDPASVVARMGRGDCTEYSVLLTALLRAFDYPARVVVGVLLFQQGDQKIQAAGHAWSEYWHQGAWHTIDASPIPTDPKYQTIALAIGRLIDEGPSWQLDLLAAVRAMPKRIEAR